MLKDLSQNMQPNGRSPVWVLMWRLRLAERGKSLPQYVHVHLPEDPLLSEFGDFCWCFGGWLTFDIGAKPFGMELKAGDMAWKGKCPGDGTNIRSAALVDSDCILGVEALTRRDVFLGAMGDLEYRACVGSGFSLGLWRRLLVPKMWVFLGASYADLLALVLRSRGISAP